MGKYLDGTGLSHFMSKVKTWVNGAFLKLTGGTLTGKLTLQSNQYTDNYSTGALDLKNSNIQGVNSIYTADASESAQEGLHFYRDATHVDSIHARNGTLYFTPNRQLGANGTSYEVLSTKGVPTTMEWQTTNPFRPTSLGGPYISKIDNAFYAADKRWSVTAEKSASGGNNDISLVFNGSYEDSYSVRDGASATITIDFTQGSEAQANGYFPNYPYGYILISFYYTEHPASVTGRVYCNYEAHGVGWHDITFSPMADNASQSCVYKGRNGYYAISCLEITVTARDSGLTSITQIEMHLDRPDSARNPFISKYKADKLYYPLTVGGIKWPDSTALPDVTKPQYFLAIDAFASGGTTKYATAYNAANTLMNALSTGSSDPQDADYYISQYVGGGSTTTTYHRRPMSALWNYIKGKISSVLGLTVSSYGGNSATATTAGNVTGTVAIANGGTGATTAAAAWTALGGGAIGKKASLAASDIPNLAASKINSGTFDAARIPSHASTATTYGAASTSSYGHVKLSSATDSSSEALAATPMAVKAAYDLATTANTNAGNAMSAATGAYVLNVTYAISNGTVTCSAHVYSAGSEVTSTFADSCFTWSYNTGSGWIATSTHAKTYTPSLLSAFGGSVKCDFTPPSS